LRRYSNALKLATRSRSVTLLFAFMRELGSLRISLRRHFGFDALLQAETRGRMKTH
jgi:hypothetical protein